MSEKSWAWELVACANGLLSGVKLGLCDIRGKGSTRCYSLVKQAQHLLDEAINLEYGQRLNTAAKKLDEDGDE